MSAAKPRARDLGVPFDGEPGPFNAITDVEGVEVGHVTLISGEGRLEVGKGPVRTGVTAILPRGKASASPVFAGWFSLNGNGEMTGTAWIEETGLLEGPILLTNTHSVGVVRDAIIAWQMRGGRLPGLWSLPVVAETWDGWLNDINGFHVRPEHVVAALETAASGPVAEGNVGGGTGNICYEFKGGIGTASRLVDDKTDRYVVGALVQANHGQRRQLLIAGVPVGRELAEEALPREESGSILIIVATNAPLLPNQLKALARRAAMGLARTGSVAGISSGDLFLAFSTGNLAEANVRKNTPVTMLGLGRLTPLFEAVRQTAEESIVNALVAAEDMAGASGHFVPALPHDRLREVLRAYYRLEE